MEANLRPGETYPVSWYPPDPLDTADYYPQAIFYNGLSLAVVATINLTKQSSGVYMGSFTVPNDPSNLGFYVIEVLKIYTDAAHTSLAPMIEIGNYKHKIKNELQNYGGGGGVDRTDYQYIRKMIQEIISEAIKNLPEIDLNDLRKEIREIRETQSPHSFALQKISEGLDELQGREIKFPQGEYQTHFNTIADGILNLERIIGKKHGEIEPMLKNHLKLQYIADHESLNKSHREIMKEMKDRFETIIEELKYRFENTDHFVLKRGSKEITKEEKPKGKSWEDYLDTAKNFIR